MRTCELLKALILLFVLIFVLAWGAPQSALPVFAQADPGTIAFVRPNDTTGDEIWLIDPDGSNAHRLWAVGEPDPNAVYAISDIDWHPNGSAIAFASNHESACSVFDSDLFMIESDGSGYRRLTNAPSCAQLADYPTGTVTVDVYNASERGPFFVYVQGSPELQMVVVPQWNTRTVTFDHVADLGDVMQQAVVIEGIPDWRYTAPIAAADVQPGRMVHAGQLDVAGNGLEDFGAFVPSWHHDGMRLGYIFGGCASLYQIDADPEVATSGQALLNEENGYVFPCVMDWGPTPAVADQIVYYSYLGNGIYQVAEGSADGGAKLVSTEAYELVYDLQWQPDGSGFLFTKLSYDENFVDSANIYAYSLALGETTQLTDFTAEFARDLNMSPDGQSIVFERSPTQEFETIDLYIMARDGSEMRMLVEDGRLPSWSGMAAPQQEPWQLPLGEIADFIAEVQRMWDEIREAVSND